jgi:uncharacterized protein (DUF433 family)
MTDVEFGVGIFPVPQAARIAGVSKAKLRRWFEGTPARPAALPGRIERVDGHVVLSFHDLVCALFVQAFRNKGVSMQHIRAVASKASVEFKDKRPFAMRRFATDGQKIFAWLSREASHNEHLVEYLTDQTVLRGVIEPLLHQLDYGDDDMAQRWWPMGKRGHVQIDPSVAFGDPTVRGTPTRVLAGPVRAGDSPELVASWFGVTTAEILAACAYEEKISLQAA